MCAQQVNGQRSAVERIAAFAKNAKAADLTTEVRALLKRDVLDSVGCAIAALPGAPFEALRAQFREYRSAESCTLHVGCRRVGEALWADGSPDRQRPGDRSGGQRIAVLRALRTGPAMEGLFARTKGLPRNNRFTEVVG
jgi:hypothetical protein